MKAPAENTQQTVARPLRVLVPLIHDDLNRGRDAAERAALPFYLAAGEKLLEAKAQLAHGEFQDWVTRHFKVKVRMARYYMQLAEQTARQNGNALPFSSLNDFIRHTSAPKVTLRIDTTLQENLQRAAEEREAQQQLAIRVIDSGYKTLARELHPDKGGSKEVMARLNAVRHQLKQPVQPMVPPRPRREATFDVLFSSESIEHYTPTEILDAVVACLGAIDLDPCSNVGTPHVPATQHFTMTDDGLAQRWTGRVFMNPPYARTIIDRWVAKLVEEYQAQRVTAALALVPARTETQWFRQLRDYPLCFVEGRLTFIGNKAGAPFPSVIAYLGQDIDGFCRAFESLGDVWMRRPTPAQRYPLELDEAVGTFIHDFEDINRIVVAIVEHGADVPRQEQRHLKKVLRTIKRQLLDVVGQINRTYEFL